MKSEDVASAESRVDKSTTGQGAKTLAKFTLLGVNRRVASSSLAQGAKILFAFNKLPRRVEHSAHD
jgi:hypothetical protein